MRSMSIARQFTLLIAAFAVAMPASVFGLAYYLHGNVTETGRLFAEGHRRTDSLFALIGSVGKAQSGVQRLLRQKDPDEIEKMLDQAKAASRKARETIQAGGAADGDLAHAFAAME